MKIPDIYTQAPGSRFLITCPSRLQEDMLSLVSSSAPSCFKDKTRLNRCAITSMDIAPDDNPTRFGDLLALCAKLISVAGTRSHYEGLLCLNIAALLGSPDNVIKLKALGELLALKDGPASRCLTLLYGPENERDLLSCLAHLDFDGRMKVICYEQPDKLRLSDILDGSKLRCASADVRRLLESAMEDMSSYDKFNALMFVQICANESGLITKESVSDMLSDPYSYLNRIKKMDKFCIAENEKRKIGFHISR